MTDVFALPKRQRYNIRKLLITDLKGIYGIKSAAPLQILYHGIIGLHTKKAIAFHK